MKIRKFLKKHENEIDYISIFILFFITGMLAIYTNINGFYLLLIFNIAIILIVFKNQFLNN